ncbi:hypothetical protein CMUS01_10557 [Colletotrichum musicola]|uniref:C2H2-type domain-containing protein n=1 Tax=Colletotrichum musicola TaxID=2175873 RepID=A0A8H6K3E7_9PEZI|nr:hypothetical protein CMUS01_10557 [Colletotrichum musicola]
MEQQGTASHFKLSATSCGTCIVRFDSPEARRAHSKSQWHATNLKRRILELLPLTAEEHAVAAAAAAALARSTAEAAWEVLSDSDEEEGWSAFGSDDERDSDTSVSDAEQDAEAAEKYFIPEECLFCNFVSDSLDDNVAHMHKAHGMFVPDRERLILDTETLVKYLHLVVRGYRECLQCGKQLRTAEAAQQHMVGKSHCRFDIAVEDSEFRDFYEEDSEDEEGAREGRKAIAGARDENGAVRLPSGKMVFHRSARAPARPRMRAGEESGNLLEGGVPDVDESGANLQLTSPWSKKDTDMKALSCRAEKLDVVFAKELARMRTTDRVALAHLSPSELRSLFLRSRKLNGPQNCARLQFPVAYH